jgi:cob(I)alamin adenosyltransferase
MKIYTKGGDKGLTSLLGGRRVPKSNHRIEAYGTVDELNAHIGLLRDQGISKPIQENLLKVQETLFVLGSRLACETDPEKFSLSNIQDADVINLEEEIDRMNNELPVLRHFILPGGHPTVSQCHVARCVCRRAERHIVLLSEKEAVDKVIIRYLNRLSDYLFILARKISQDLGTQEKKWPSGK